MGNVFNYRIGVCLGMFFVSERHDIVGKELDGLFLWYLLYGRMDGEIELDLLPT